MRSCPQAAGQAWRVIERLGPQAIEFLEPSRGVLRVREEAPTFAQHLTVQSDQRIPKADIALGVCEVAVLGATEIIGRAVLMNQPRHLVWMPDKVRRELRSNGQVDGLSVALAQVQEAPRRRVRENFLLGIPLEGEAHEFG